MADAGSTKSLFKITANESEAHEPKIDVSEYQFTKFFAKRL